jgi:hypothetical protein
MSKETLSQSLMKWLDQVLSQSIPQEVTAFNVNLYESADCFQAQLIGAATYDPNNAEWACNDIFTTGENVFELPHTSVGTEWAQALRFMQHALCAYVLQHPESTHPFRRVQALTVGFVDGDLEPILCKRGRET